MAQTSGNSLSTNPFFLAAYRATSPARAPLLVLLLLVTGCSWISLGLNALIYRTTESGETNNVLIRGNTAFYTLGEKGMGILDLAAKRTVRIIAPPTGSESIDDLALGENFLFALDARPPGHLFVYSLTDDENPALIGNPIGVPVAPFSGVSAAAGSLIVSGGTSELTAFHYDKQGRLSITGTLDLGRGQPDVTLSPDGRRAFVSTHYSGPDFGITMVDLTGAAPKQITTFAVRDAGFTSGGAKPANFPIELAVTGKSLFIAHQAGLGISTLEDPAQVRVLPLGVRAVNVDVWNGTAAVVGSSPRPVLVIVDVRNPETPSVIRTENLPPGSYPTGVAINERYIIIAAHDAAPLIVER